MAEIKFYKDAEKTNQVYPEINPDGNYPGITVGLANNLVSTDGTTIEGAFNFRTAGGTADISDGYAQLTILEGATDSTTIKESLVYNLLTTGVTSISIDSTVFNKKISETGTYEFIYTPIVTTTGDAVYHIDENTFATKVGLRTGNYAFTYTASVSQTDTNSLISTFDTSTFIAKVNEKPDIYSFEYREDSKWYLDTTAVTLSDYGIKTTGKEEAGNTFTINYSSNSWYYSGASVSLSSYGITSTGQEKVGDTITVNYTANEWHYGDTKITLSDYGITINMGEPAAKDDIQVVYTAEQVGVITIANPTSLFTTGLNQFNAKDTSKIFTQYKIDDSGNIVTSSSTDDSVVYLQVLAGNTYTVAEIGGGSIGNVGFTQSVPTNSSTGLSVYTPVTTASSGQSVTNSTDKKYFTPSYDGYLCITCTNINTLCVHLTWSGYNDDVYESYWEYNLPLSFQTTDGQPITEYGLARIDSTYYDYVDLANSKFYKGVDRLENTAENMAWVKDLATNYIYDDNYIYYGLDGFVEYNISSISAGYYRVSDFGIERFLGTDLELNTKILYQTNLKDKLRRSVEVNTNKTYNIDENSTNEQYSSAKAVYNIVDKVWDMLGLSDQTFSTTSTYAVGDYVVYKHKLYKCTTAVTSAGAWTGIASTAEILTDSNSILASYNMSTMYTGTKSYFSSLTNKGKFSIEYKNGTVYFTNLSTNVQKIITDASSFAKTMGITFSGNTGSMTYSVHTTGNWTESYLFTN